MIYNSIIKFYPKIGLGILLFSFSEKEIINILGQPDSVEKKQEEIGEYVLNMYYSKWSLGIFVHYENNIFDYTSFHVADLFLDNVKFSNLSKKELLEFIEFYHNKYDILYDCVHSFDSSVNEEDFYYKNLGLTLWFEENEISDICVNQIQEE